jgi:hypothetical protein
MPRPFRSPRPVLLALLIGVLVAAWWPNGVLAAPGMAVAQGEVVSGARAMPAPMEAADRLPTALATWPTHARHWSWHRGHSRRGGRDVETALGLSALPGSIPACVTFTERDVCGTRSWRRADARGISRGAASPRAPPSQN